MCQRDTTMIEKLPFKKDIETKEVLKLATKAHGALGELKGVAQTIPNKEVLLNLLPLQEAKYSSEVENIITTHDELYKSKVENNINNHTKEVRDYEKALLDGFKEVQNKKLLINNMICNIQEIIKKDNAGFRKQTGTHLKNNMGDIIYTPPQHADEVQSLMNNLEKFINDDTISDIDPLIKMAIIHHQFESIHPFYDGNGRVGRIINVLYLCLKGLLDLPILYLSRFIIENKHDYYILLQEVRDKNNWQEWIAFMLKGVIRTSQESIFLIKEILKLMLSLKNTIREKHPKIYSQDLINSICKYPYTKIDFMAKDLKIHRQTAANYLNILSEEKILIKYTIGRSNYYLNQKLIDTSLEVRKIFFNKKEN